jgi:GNAT superfamily N-acetyltransferase
VALAPHRNPPLLPPPLLWHDMPQPPPFVIFTSSRSRSFWLSRFLSYDEWSCGHEEARHLRGLDDIRSWLAQPFTGTVETSAAPFWRLIPALHPDARVVVVRRPPGEVVESLLRLGLPLNRAELERRMLRQDLKLSQIARRLPSVMVVSFSDLATEAACAAVFEHCLPHHHDHAWWERLAAVNLQINLPAMFRYEAAHSTQLRTVEYLCKRRILSDIRARRRSSNTGGVIIQEERYEDAWDDAQALMSEHLVEVGEVPNSHLAKNIPLFHRLADAGSWQIITARMNGRMVGYLSSIIGPSLETTDLICTQLSMFVTKDARGMGIHTKLQRASVEVARARGAKRVMMRAGTRGAGARLGILYRRFGAHETGTEYRLDLQEAA